MTLRALLCLLALALAPAALAQNATPAGNSSVEVRVSHAIAMNGQPKYPADFAHFDYVNPDAPKGGELRLSELGGFDSFNPFIVKGEAAGGVGAIYDTLTVKSDDEPFTEYGLLAEKIEWPEDRSWVVFHLRPEAKFHDGHAVTAEDVAFTFELLMTKGAPQYKQIYQNVAKAEALDDRRVKFTFQGDINNELPLIVGQMQVLPKHYWESRDFSASSLEIPLGSGPYTLASFRPGQSVVYERVEDYWGKDLPVNLGANNFGRIRYDYYRDSTVAVEAFKAGEYDLRQEYIAKAWATEYSGPLFDKGIIVKAEIPHELPQGMQGFVFNMRRPPFDNVKVREALAYAFNWEWSNKNLFYGQYTRSESYFSNSELASSGLPQGREKEILEKYRDKLPPEVFTQEPHAPRGDVSGAMRDALRQALGLLREAGFETRDGKLVNAATGQPLSFEILLAQQEFERIALPYAKNLERLGVTLKTRVVDTAQYINRVRDFDFDVVVTVFGQSLSPGNEQRYFWGSKAADIPGTSNLMGLKNPVVDELVELVINAPDREELVQRTRALDRVLLWSWLVVPHWHLGYFRVVYWDKFGIPAVQPKYALGLMNWWVDPTRDARLKDEMGRMKK